MWMPNPSSLNFCSNCKNFLYKELLYDIVHIPGYGVHGGEGETPQGGGVRRGRSHTSHHGKAAILDLPSFWIWRLLENFAAKSDLPSYHNFYRLDKFHFLSVFFVFSVVAILVTPPF
jgi:hypothetical protein